MTLPSCGEKRELVTWPAAAPSRTTTAPSVGTCPLAIVKPTSAVCGLALSA